MREVDEAVKVFRRELRRRAIRLLLLRAGGRYRMFEAGMLYECLTLLGMSEYMYHSQVQALEKIVCSFLSESEAEKQLDRLLNKGA